jgi:hypothetical protein
VGLDTHKRSGAEYLDELNDSFVKAFPKKQLSKSETDIGDEVVDTRRVLQVLWAMMPEALFPKGKLTHG